MTLVPERIGKRERLVLAGLFLSKFNSTGLRRLGFGSFAEAYNAIGFALGSQPASIKNYRDEFDPLFPNPRKGWHKRPIRDYCKKVYDEYNCLDIDLFSGLIKSLAGYDENAWSVLNPPEERDESESAFARRLITGLAAEMYFESVHTSLTEFEGYSAENTTRIGCGYDFKMYKADREDFFAVEVKGLRDLSGSLQLTPKEYAVAESMRDHFFLFVVKNFQKIPFHEIFPDPLSGPLKFTKSERVLVEVSWLTQV
jgi:hypothetical protein